MFVCDHTTSQSLFSVDPGQIEVFDCHLMYNNAVISLILVKRWILAAILCDVTYLRLLNVDRVSAIEFFKLMV